MPSAPTPPTLPAVSDVLGPPPKAPHAPHAPDVEDVLGPPPHAPHIGRHGKALALTQRLHSRPPSPPRLGRRVESQQSKAQANLPQPQKIVIEQKGPPPPPVPTRKKTLQEEYASDEPEVSQFAGRPIARKARAAAQVADKINPLRHQSAADEARDEEQPSSEPRPANAQAHHDETRRQVREARERLRGNGEAQP